MNFIENRDANIALRQYRNNQWDNIKSIKRVEDMCIYRNNMKNLCTSWDNSDFSIILDTDIEFDNDILDEMMLILYLYNNIAMVTPYGLVSGKNIYYDTFALDLNCFGHPLHTLQKLAANVNNNTLIQLKSGFSGFIMIRSSVLQHCNWGVSNYMCSEHNFFCSNVRKYGNIVCATQIRVNWVK